MIIVACYQDFPPETRLPYVPVCNLRADNTKPEGFLFYDRPENLASRNHSYCELSAFRDSLDYFGEEEWLGLAHYRRMFIKSTGKPFLYTKDISYSRASFLRKHEADEASWNLRMKNIDLVVGVRESMTSLGFNNSYEQYCANHPSIYFEYLNDIIRSNFPKMPSFIDYHKSNSGMSFYNMLVGKNTIIREYANFLYPILEQCEPFIGFERKDYQGRWAGFLGERLLNYWIDHASTVSSLRVDEMTVAIANRPNQKIPNILKNSVFIRRIKSQTQGLFN